jgi:hypothetical protein
MNDADVIEGVEALCESALGNNDEQSVCLLEILRLIRKRKAEREEKYLPLHRLVTDPKPQEDF